MSSHPSQPTLRSPLHHFGLTARAKPMDASHGVWANELTSRGHISLRGHSDDSAFVDTASRALDLRLPTEPCTFSASGPIRCLWLSPDEWIVSCPRERISALVRELEEAFASIRSQVVDNSGGYTEIRITGRDAAQMLAHCTVYDLAKLAAGRVVGTTFGKSSVYLHREGDSFILIVRPSFADYIWRYLERASAPYEFEIAAENSS